MNHARMVIAVLLIALAAPAVCVGQCSTDNTTSSWTATIHKENSIVASVLYLPYMVFSTPIRIIDGIINPCPTTRTTIPPAAHKAGPVPIR